MHDNNHSTKGILWENLKNRGNMEDRFFLILWFRASCFIVVK